MCQILLVKLNIHQGEEKKIKKEIKKTWWLWKAYLYIFYDLQLFTLWITLKIMLTCSYWSMFSLLTNSKDCSLISPIFKIILKIKLFSYLFHLQDFLQQLIFFLPTVKWFKKKYVLWATVYLNFSFYFNERFCIPVYSFIKEIGIP